jgi:hypothetical protein
MVLLGGSATCCSTHTSQLPGANTLLDDAPTEGELKMFHPSIMLIFFFFCPKKIFQLLLVHLSAALRIRHTLLTTATIPDSF